MCLCGTPNSSSVDTRYCRFGPTDVDVAGMHFLLHQNEQGFVAAVHPMVNVLLNHYLKLVKDLKQANQVPAVQPEQPQPPQA